MENEQAVSTDTFVSSAIAAIQEAISFARNGDGEALQKVLNEIFVYHYQNYTDSTQPEAEAADALNSVDMSRLVTVEGISDDEIAQFLMEALNVPDEEPEEEVLEGGQMATKSQGTTTEVEVPEVTTAPETAVGAEAEVVAAAETAAEVQPVVEPDEPHASNSEPEFLNLHTRIEGIKSQGERNEEMLGRLLEKLTSIERAFVVTAPSSPPVAEVESASTDGRPGAKSATSKPATVHRLKFGSSFADSSGVDEDAVKRMTRRITGGK